MPEATADMLRRVSRNYRVGALGAFVGIVVAVIAFITESQRAPLDFPPGIYVFSPYYSLGLNLVTLAIMVTFERIAHRASRLESTIDRTVRYRRIWDRQSGVGVLYMIAAVIMVPVSLVALQLGATGVAFIVPAAVGAYVHMMARRIHRDSTTEAAVAVPDSTTHDFSAVAPESADPAVIATLTTSTRPTRPPVAPIVVAACAGALVAIPLLVEANLVYLELQARAPGGSAAGSGFARGLMMFLDITALTALGVVVLILGIVNLVRKVKPALGWTTIALTLLSFGVTPGVATQSIADALGGSGPINVDNLPEPAEALRLIDEYRQTHPDDNPNDLDAMTKSLSTYSYDGGIRAFANDSGSVLWLQEDYPDQGSICVSVLPDQRDGSATQWLVQVSGLESMAFFGDFVVGECPGTEVPRMGAVIG